LDAISGCRSSRLFVQFAHDKRDSEFFDLPGSIDAGASLVRRTSLGATSKCHKNIETGGFISQFGRSPVSFVERRFTVFDLDREGAKFAPQFFVTRR
jgi:hypothetical protein